MPEIRLVKKYPHIKDEDVTSIFQEGYIKGFENGRKGAIPVEWIEKWVVTTNMGAGRTIDRLLEDWEKENSLDKQIEKWEIDDDVDWEMIQREQGNDE